MILRQRRADVVRKAYLLDERGLISMLIETGKIVSGYRLQELMSFNNTCYALGWNMARSAPFATWKIVGTGQNWDFHFFYTLPDARFDLLTRCLHQFTAQELSELLPENLSSLERETLLKLIFLAKTKTPD